MILRPVCLQGGGTATATAMATPMTEERKQFLLRGLHATILDGRIACDGYVLPPPLLLMHACTLRPHVDCGCRGTS
jgi:hypothetical protein